MRPCVGDLPLIHRRATASRSRHDTAETPCGPLERAVRTCKDGGAFSKLRVLLKSNFLQHSVRRVSAPPERVQMAGSTHAQNMIASATFCGHHVHPKQRGEQGRVPEIVPLAASCWPRERSIQPCKDGWSGVSPENGITCSIL